MQTAREEAELLAHSVAYESAPTRQTPFSSREAASVFPSRRVRGDTGSVRSAGRKKRGNVPIGLEVLREVEIAAAVSSRAMSERSAPSSRSSGDSAADRYRTERQNEEGHGAFLTPLGSARRLPAVAEEYSV